MISKLFKKNAAKAANVTNKIKNIGKFDIGVGAVFGVNDYNDSRAEGSGVLSSLAYAGSELALPMILGGWSYLGFKAATIAPELAVSGLEKYNSYGRSIAREKELRPFSNSQFEDTRSAVTMRQAGMALAQQSKYNLQQARLGNEAKFMHR